MNINRLDEHMGIEEVARELGLSRQAVYGWRFSGRHKERLPIYKAGSGKLFCLRSDFEEFKPYWLHGEEAIRATKQ